jgi:hypothetical protein
MVQQNAVHDRLAPPIRPTTGSTAVMATEFNLGDRCRLIAPQVANTRRAHTT